MKHKLVNLALASFVGSLLCCGTVAVVYGDGPIITRLKQLYDVRLQTTPTDGDVLKYNSSLGKWTNGVVSGSALTSNSFITNLTINYSGTNTALTVYGPVVQNRVALTTVGGTNVLIDCVLGNDFSMTYATNIYLIFTNVPSTTNSWVANIQLKNSGSFTVSYSATNLIGTNLTFPVVTNSMTLLSVVNSAITSKLVVGNTIVYQ